MSYTIRIDKDAEGIHIDDSGLAHIPDGVITISGHHVPPGEQGTAFVQVIVNPAVGGYIRADAAVEVDRRAENTVNAEAKP